MKVICINSGIHTGAYGIPQDARKFLVEGNTYFIETVIENSFNEIGYVLAEVKSPSLKGSFASERFVPCSDIDETILINNKNNNYEPVLLR